MNGFCGSCKGSLLSGNVEYPQGKPGGLDEEAIKNNEALFCKEAGLDDKSLHFDSFDYSSGA